MSPAGKRNRRVYDLGGARADYPAADGPPRRSIVLCTAMRSGSTLLGEAMYFAGGLGCPLEYYHLGFRPSFEERWGVHGIRAYTARLHHCRTDQSGTFSIKLFWSDVIELIREMAPHLSGSLPGPAASQWSHEHYRQVWATIAPLFPNPVFVWLRRDDEIGQAISAFVAGSTRRYRNFSGQAATPEPDYDFEIIVQELAAAQNNNRHWERFFLANPLRPRTVLYEDLSTDYEATISGLLADLGAHSRSAPSPRLQRQRGRHSELFRERFLNDFQLFARGER